MIYNTIVERIMLYRAEKWTMNIQHQKLLSTQVDYWRRVARRSRMERVRNETISKIMEVEVIEQVYVCLLYTSRCV